MKPENRYLVCPRCGGPLVEHRDYHFMVKVKCAGGRCQYTTGQYEKPSLAWLAHEMWVDRIYDEGEEDEG